MTALRIALCQLNCAVGDLDGNVERIVSAVAEAEGSGADLAILPELAITGYPPEDLVLKHRFVEDNLRALATIADRVRGHCAVAVGFVDRSDAGLHNAAALLSNGEIVGRYHKRRLPNYAVFDEERYFEPGTGDPQLFSIAGVTVGMSICEDAWAPGGPIVVEARAGAQLVVNLNASPYHMGKVPVREGMLAERALESGVPVAYVNLVGGQDELVFDGASMVVDERGAVVARAVQYEESIVFADVVCGEPRPAPSQVVDVSAPVSARPVIPSHLRPCLSLHREAYEALVLGTRDYVRKNGFREVVLGLSGGIDSSLVATIAVDALGADHVHGVLMPSRYSSDHSITDAEQLVKNLGIDHRTIEIEPVHAAFMRLLSTSFEGTESGVAEENIQPRIRGTLLMGLSNKFGWLVLTTGNKSEMAVGYATLYGDMAGGFAVIKDVPKTLVFALARDRNERAGFDLIPDHVLHKPPSAELKPDQLDTDSLPPYEVLDPILGAYVEGDETATDLIAAGHDEALVRRVVRLVDVNEYKRRQAPPGPRITTKAFGKDRRLPITNAYRG